MKELSERRVKECPFEGCDEVMPHRHHEGEAQPMPKAQEQGAEATGTTPLHHALHAAWTWAVGKAGYDKAVWRACDTERERADRAESEMEKRRQAAYQVELMLSGAEAKAASLLEQITKFQEERLKWRSRMGLAYSTQHEQRLKVAEELLREAQRWTSGDAWNKRVETLLAEEPKP